MQYTSGLPQSSRSRRMIEAPVILPQKHPPLRLEVAVSPAELFSIAQSFLRGVCLATFANCAWFETWHHV